MKCVCPLYLFNDWYQSDPAHVRDVWIIPIQYIVLIINAVGYHLNL